MSKTALLFAGQGAQTVGMGKALAAEFPSAKAWFDTDSNFGSATSPAGAAANAEVSTASNCRFKDG